MIQQSAAQRAPGRTSVLAAGAVRQDRETDDSLLPPSTDRGATITVAPTEPLIFHPDWIGITVKNPDLNIIGSQLANILFYGVLPGFVRRNSKNWIDIVTTLQHGARGYRTVYVMPQGAKLYCDPVNTSHGNHMNFEIPGTVLDAVGNKAIQALYRMLDGYFPGSWHHTRLDLAWDHVPFTPRDIFQAVSEGNVRTYAKRESLRWIEEPFNSQGGATCYLGSRNSERMLRVYDKRGFTRLELELKGARAKAIGRILADENLDGWSTLAIGHLRDFIDLVDRQVSKNASRAPLLDIWESFINEAPAACLRITRKTLETIGEVKNWFRKSIAPSLALILQASGGDLDALIEVAEDGRRRWGQRHRMLLASAGIEGLHHGAC